MEMGLGVRTGLGHGCITCVLQTQFSSFSGVIRKPSQCACNMHNCLCFKENGYTFWESNSAILISASFLNRTNS